jgi:ribonuclease HII
MSQFLPSKKKLLDEGNPTIIMVAPMIQKIEYNIHVAKRPIIADAKYQYLVGVDEAGRGPLAGPVSVGVAVIPYDFDWDLLPGVGDSKKVSPKVREVIFRKAQKLRQQKMLDYRVVLIPNSTIDRINISRAVFLGIDRCFKKLALDPKRTHVKLDGLLKAPSEFHSQETIIKGDAKEKIIGLASILAKVTRDRLMVRKAQDFPEYSFEIHKGYGTSMHRAAIVRHGISPFHRKSFCRKIRITQHERV